MSRFTYQDDVRLSAPFMPTINSPRGYEQDEYRLPEGMQRIGYDADTQQSTFRDADGTLYESAPGNRYGELYPAGHRFAPEEVEQRNKAVEKGNRDAVRMMLPFALLVIVFMLLLFKAVNGGFGFGGGSLADDSDTPQALDCHDGSHQVQIEKGDTCWKIAQECRLGVEDLLGLGGNGAVDCDKLRVGQGICVPA